MGPKDAVTMARIDAAQQQYQVQKDKYERLRSDVTIKLKFLEENKVSFYSVSSCKRKISSILCDVHKLKCVCVCLPGQGDAQAAPPLP